MIEMMKNTATGPQFDGTAAESASQSGSSGRERRIFDHRLMIQSVRPPK